MHVFPSRAAVHGRNQSDVGRSLTASVWPMNYERITNSSIQITHMAEQRHTRLVISGRPSKLETALAPRLSDVRGFQEKSVIECKNAPVIVGSQAGIRLAQTVVIPRSALVPRKKHVRFRTIKEPWIVPGEQNSGRRYEHKRLDLLSFPWRRGQAQARQQFRWRAWNYRSPILAVIPGNLNERRFSIAFEVLVTDGDAEAGWHHAHDVPCAALRN